MKLEVKDILKKIEPALAFVKKYAAFSAIIVAIVLISYLVYRINQLSQIEPTDTAVLEKLNKIPRPRVEPSTLTKIQQLQDQNVEVKALFDEARENPFDE